MNKFLSNIFNNKGIWIKIVGCAIDFFVSFLSLILIPNIIISILFIVGILVINVLNMCILDKNVIESLSKKNLLNSKVKNIFLISLFMLAIIPLFVGLIEKANFIELLFGNTIPNILGAFTVLTLIIHMSEFNYSNFVIKILQAKYIINVILRIFYYFCFLNSVKFFINKNLKYTNFCNNTYLFFVIISGLIVGSAFFYRIFIDDNKFDFSPKEVYPTATLYCGAAFLISCAVPSYFIEVEITPILLVLNTITAFIVALALLYFIICKSDRSSSEYPFIQFGVFTIILILNCFVYIVHNVENVGDILYQFFTGGSILIAVILALYILSKNIKKKDNKEKDKQE